MNVLLTTLQYLGHIVPAAVFKQALEQRGHFVHWEICAVESPSGPLEKHLANFAKAEPAQYAHLSSLLKERDFDCLLSDPAIFAGWNLHRDFGIPWAIFGNLPIFYSDPGVPLYLQCSLPDFEPKVRTENVKFIGPMVPHALIEKGKTPWWIGIPSKIVHVTQGTVVEKDYLSKAAIAALWEDFNYPILVMDKFPHCHWLKQIDVFVTNGGFSGVSQAMAFGVPMVIAGTTEDKAIVAERAESMGVAINLKTDYPEPEILREAIFFALHDSKMRTRCKEIAQKCRFFSADRGVDHLEELVFGQPAEKVLQSA